jgi:hypothetical protein
MDAAKQLREHDLVGGRSLARRLLTLRGGGFRKHSEAGVHDHLGNARLGLTSNRTIISN